MNIEWSSFILTVAKLFPLFIFLIAIIFSLFYGFRAVWIFIYADPKNPPPKYTKSWWVHQFWINFIGSITGWLILWLLYEHFKIMKINDVVSKITINIEILFVVGLISIMGYLPFVLVTLTTSIQIIISQIVTIIQKLFNSFLKINSL